jgi:hypothetical protein
MGALILALGLESLEIFKTFPFNIEGESDFKALATQVQDGDPIVILPLSGQDHFGTLSNITSQLVGSRHRWWKLVAGYGARSTPELAELIYREQLVAGGHHQMDSIIEWARKTGIKYVYLRMNAVNETTKKAWANYEAAHHPDYRFVEANILMKL